MNETAMAQAIADGCEVPDWRKEFRPNMAHQLEHSDAYAPPGFFRGGRPLYSVWMRTNSKSKGRRRNTVDANTQARVYKLLKRLRAENA